MLRRRNAVLLLPDSRVGDCCGPGAPSRRAAIPSPATGPLWSYAGCRHGRSGAHDRYRTFARGSGAGNGGSDIFAVVIAAIVVRVVAPLEILVTLVDSFWPTAVFFFAVILLVGGRKAALNQFATLGLHDHGAELRGRECEDQSGLRDDEEQDLCSGEDGKFVCLCARGKQGCARWV